MVHHIFACTFGADRHITNRERCSQRLHFFLLHDKVHFAAYHHFGHLLLAGTCHINGSDTASFSKYGTAVCHCLNLSQFVCDEQNGFSFGYQLFHDFHKLIDLLGCQHSGGFVKDEDIIIAVEHF